MNVKAQHTCAFSWITPVYIDLFSDTQHPYVTELIQVHMDK